MKLNTLQKANFVGEYWTFTIEQDPFTGASTTTFVYAGPIRAIVTPSTVRQDGLALYSPVPLMMRSQIRNLRDKSGKPLFSDDGVQAEPAVVGAVQPQVNVYGVIEGWRYQLERGYTNG